MSTSTRILIELILAEGQSSQSARITGIDDCTFRIRSHRNWTVMYCISAFITFIFYVLQWLIVFTSQSRSISIVAIHLRIVSSLLKGSHTHTETYIWCLRTKLDGQVCTAQLACFYEHSRSQCRYSSDVVDIISHLSSYSRDDATTLLL